MWALKQEKKSASDSDEEAVLCHSVAICILLGQNFVLYLSLHSICSYFTLICKHCITFLCVCTLLFSFQRMPSVCSSQKLSSYLILPLPNSAQQIFHQVLTILSLLYFSISLVFLSPNMLVQAIIVFCPHYCNTLSTLFFVTILVSNQVIF